MRSFRNAYKIFCSLAVQTIIHKQCCPESSLQLRKNAASRRLSYAGTNQASGKENCVLHLVCQISHALIETLFYSIKKLADKYS